MTRWTRTAARPTTVEVFQVEIDIHVSLDIGAGAADSLVLDSGNAVVK